MQKMGQFCVGTLNFFKKCVPSARKFQILLKFLLKLRANQISIDLIDRFFTENNNEECCVYRLVNIQPASRLFLHKPDKAKLIKQKVNTK